MFKIYPVFICFLFWSCSQKAAKHANVILIIVDHLGFSDLGINGAPYPTPEINDISEQSTLYTNAYSTGSVSAPSLASIYTGLYPTNHGLLGADSISNEFQGQTQLESIRFPKTLDEKKITIAEILGKTGYKTIHIGKWSISENPRSFGFNENVGGSMSSRAGSSFSPFHLKNLNDGKPGENLTDFLTQNAIQYIRKFKHKPFFISLAYYDINPPIEVKECMLDKMNQLNLPEGKNNLRYSAMVRNLDKNIGKIWMELENLGLKDNTLFIITSTSGGIAAFSSQKPYRAGSGSYYEGGIRIPLIIHYPGMQNVAEKYTGLVSGIDIFPTILDVCHLLEPNTKYSDEGISLISAKEMGDSINARELFWYFPFYLSAFDPEKDQSRDSLFRTRPGAAVRVGDWKLIRYFEDNSLELFNLKTDPGENKNLVLDNPEKKNELKLKLDAYLIRSNAQIPSLKKERRTSLQT